jgi:hypothetical protein
MMDSVKSTVRLRVGKESAGIRQLDDTPTGEEELEDDFADLRHRSLSQDISERKLFAERAYCITKTWMFFLIVVTTLQFFLRKYGFGLSGTEFNVVFSTTTASILIFWYLVGRYLFSYKK